MFLELFNLMQDSQMLTITLMRKDDELVVCVLPTSKGSLGTDLSPMSITATPQELDDKFIEVIQTPLQKRCEVLTNLEEFQKDTQKVVDKTKKTSVETSKGALTAPTTKSSKQLEEAEQLENAGNLPAAYGLYKKIYEQDKTNVKVGEKMQAVWAKMSQKDLFHEDPKVAIEQQQEAEEVFAPTIVSDDEVAEEENETKTDMFQQLVDESKKEPQIIQAAAQTNFDAEQWKQFQEFQKMQQQAQTVEV